MNNTRNFIVTTILLLLFGVFGCANDSGGGLDLSSITSESTDLTPFLTWEWIKDSNDGTQFTYLFKTDGTISTVHCCGEEFSNQFSYLFNGNVFVTYGSEMDTDKLEVTTFTITDNGATLNLSNKTTYKRGNARTSSGLTLELTNDLIGTWKGSNGNNYVFGSDASLKIGSVQYGYLVRKSNIVTLGSDGKTVDYTFTLDKATGILTLKGNTTITLSK